MLPATAALVVDDDFPVITYRRLFRLHHLHPELHDLLPFYETSRLDLGDGKALITVRVLARARKAA